MTKYVRDQRVVVGSARRASGDMPSSRRRRPWVSLDHDHRAARRERWPPRSLKHMTLSFLDVHVGAPAPLSSSPVQVPLVQNHAHAGREDSATPPECREVNRQRSIHQNDDILIRTAEIHSGRRSRSQIARRNVMEEVDDHVGNTRRTATLFERSSPA